ncbi:SURF1 family protein [Pseudooctadecabacter jejudonensis]|uniref:SURF1-like protein n=1 Tax=Pseudooctadecabacter jejudonensis TaxID=1391910 RepID=A0A1Y5SVH8_9RHOB|nr:SURF1 family protein [Pseudooctadecabacter jejudonensis]SLN49295.1 SURF1 family protein [Pseudooctadecabacter jejudonensis]
MRKLLFPVIIGAGGIAILLHLMVWQINRLEWKEAVIAQIEARLTADPVPLPETVDPEADNYLTVILQGTPTGEELRFLDSGTPAGTGHRIISAFETREGRRIMVDQGLLEKDDTAAQAAAPATQTVTVQGNLIWPDDVSDQAPDGDEWYARDVPAMAAALNTDPVLVVLAAASDYDPRLTPLPVDTRTIKNDHLEYAITWGLLAIVWGAMTIFYVARGLRRKDT